MRFRVCVVALTMIGIARLTAQDAMPRTAWGDPDLEGVWLSANVDQTPFQRPADNDDTALRIELIESGAFERTRGDVESIVQYEKQAIAEWRLQHPLLTSLVIDPADGRMPAMTAEARRRIMDAWKTTWTYDGPWNSAEDFGPDERCISRGVLGSMLPSADHGAIQIVQAPGIVTIRTEAIHEARVIPIDAPPHAGAQVRSYMGDPRGFWDGDALVIETTNFNGRTGARGNGNDLPTSPTLHVTERFTPAGRERIDVQITIDDPGTWVAPWTVAFPLSRSTDYEITEYACHEANAPFIRTALGGSR